MPNRPCYREGALISIWRTVYLAIPGGCVVTRTHNRGLARVVTHPTLAPALLAHIRLLLLLKLILQLLLKLQLLLLRLEPRIFLSLPLQHPLLVILIRLRVPFLLLLLKRLLLLLPRLLLLPVRLQLLDLPCIQCAGSRNRQKHRGAPVQQNQDGCISCHWLQTIEHFRPRWMSSMLPSDVKLPGAFHISSVLQRKNSAIFTPLKIRYAAGFASLSRATCP